MARHNRAMDLLNLQAMIRASDEGVTITEIQERYGISRKTVERWLTALRQISPVEGVRGEDGQKRWRMARDVQGSLLDASMEEVDALRVAVERLTIEGPPELAARLRSLLDKMMVFGPVAVQRRYRTDLEFLAQAESQACRPGPQVEIDRTLWRSIHEATLKSRRIRVRYARPGRAEREHVLEPFGILLGQRHYLLARRPPHQRLGHYALGRIRTVAILEEMFERGEETVADYARQLFGVFHEEPVDTVWRFDARVAPWVREFRFHPSQTQEDGPDGSIIVRLRAAGRVEMAWHLFQWGPWVEILAPESLRTLYADLIRRAQARLDGHAPPPEEDPVVP